ncbi:MAG: flagellar biosynthesis regulator FlaF [Roseicyclus sp.]
MSTALLAQTAYAATAPVRTPRATEYAAFQKVTARLVQASRDGAPMTELAAAIYENRRLWTTLAIDLADDGNALPKPLRAQLMYLAEFSLLGSSKALRDRAALRPLIEVNTAVMRGLSGQDAAT